MGYAGHQAPPLLQDPDSGPLHISVDIALVVLHATVSDRQGGFVSNLGQGDFEVYEDGVPQPIRLFSNEDIPVTVGLVVDHSTSMGSRIAEVTAAARAFVQSSNREDEMFVVNFNERVSLGLPGTIRFTDSTAELGNAIAAARTRGMTALYDAVAKGLEELQAGSRDKKVLILVSDGGDNASSHSLAEVMKLAGQSSAVIYTVGIFEPENPERNLGVLKSLAQATGGEAFLPEKLSEVTAICEGIARDIRHQYTIGYEPSDLTHGRTYHSIRVVARAKGRHGALSVRTRTGYIASGEPRHDDKTK
jgi:VWFA-related protein